jgi:DNA-damage-inducible protein J
MNQRVDISISMDRDLKERADMLFSEMGLNMTIAVNTFIKQCLREQSMPFQMDDYRSKIEYSLQQADEGKLIEFSMDELDFFENAPTDKALELIKNRRREASL